MANELCFTAIENSRLSFNTVGSVDLSGLQFSIDDGKTWDTWGYNSTAISTKIETIDKNGARRKVDRIISAVGYEIIIVMGDKVLIRNTKGSLSTDDSNYFKFVITHGKLNASGNVQSLVNFGSVTSHVFYRLFSGCDLLVTAPDLPATDLATNCYAFMFSDCTSLVRVASKLPSGRVHDYAYYSMFSNCTSLVVPPRIAASVVQTKGCAYMFDGCSSLDVRVDSKLGLSFFNCISVDDPSDLIDMFRGCGGTSPATPVTGTEYCYFSNKCGDDLSWEYNEDKKILTIDGDGPMWDFSPWPPWFNITTEIKFIELSSEITYLPEFAFIGCTAVESVTIPPWVEVLKLQSFYNVASGTESCEITFPSNSELVEIGNYVFTNGGLHEAILPNSLKKIGDGAFDGNRKLTIVNFGNSITHIGTGGFSRCGLKGTLTFPASLQTVDSGAFVDNPDMDGGNLILPENKINFAKGSLGFGTEGKHVTVNVIDAPSWATQGVLDEAGNEYTTFVRRTHSESGMFVFINGQWRPLSAYVFKNGQWRN